MKKRIPAFMLAVLLCITMVPMGAAGEDDRPVRDSGTTAHGVNWTLYEDGTFVLSPKDDFQTYFIDYDDIPWQNREYTVNGEAKEIRDLITSLVIKDRVGIIMSNLFAGYYNLTEVTLPGMYEIPNATFWECCALKTVTVRGSLNRIGIQAFAECNSLNTVTIRGNAGHIGNQAFKDCTSLTSFIVDGTVSSVGKAAFSGCENLKAFDAPVTGDIGDYAFLNCWSLNRFSPIRGSVGEKAFPVKEEQLFLYIVSTHSGTIGTIDTNDGNRIVLRYTGTEEEFASRYTNNSGFTMNAYNSIGDDVKWILSDGVLEIFGYGSTIDLLDKTEQPWVNIPGKGDWDEQWNAITKVRIDPRIEFGTHMLDNLEGKVEYIYDLSGTLGTISWGMRNNILFVGGTGDIPNLYGQDDTAWMPYRGDIREIVIRDGITAVGFGAFNGCVNLENVRFSDSVKRVDGGAFYGCPKLNKVSLPEGLTTIGRNAFTDCTGLKAIYIPGSVTSVGSQAFMNTGLTDIYFGGRTEEWEALNVQGVGDAFVHMSSPGLLPGVGVGAEPPSVGAPGSESPAAKEGGHVILWIALIILSCAVIAALVIVIIKRSSDRRSYRETK